ncbi:MAG: RNA methyltransferase [Verrucomicrobiales bacterium]|nr:RNA methyltransferase [Verrucomicrobiales bacterium]
MEALLDSSFEVIEVVLEKERHSLLLDRLKSDSIPFREESPEILTAERGFPFHRGVYATAVRPHPSSPSDRFLARVSRLVVPYSLADPGNLGTIIRSAAAFGAQGVVLESGLGADVFGAKCVRASATAVFRIPIFEVPSISAEFLRFRDAGFVSFGTSLREGAVKLSQVNSVAKSVVLLGSEEEGLPAAVEALCDKKVTIPMANEIDSLNVAASAAIAFYELFRGTPE